MAAESITFTALQTGKQMISKRTLSFGESACLRAKEVVRARKAADLPFFDFGLGETKGRLPGFATEAGIRALKEGATGYMPPAGIPELREKVIQWLELPPSYTAENIVVTVGAKQSIFNTFSVLCDPGDALFVECAPWVSYLPIADTLAINAAPVPVDPSASGSLKVTPAQLEKAALSVERPKLLLVNSPCNPTGHVYTLEELSELVEVCKKHGMFLVFDQIYWKLLYDGMGHAKLLDCPEFQDSVIVIDALSKSFRGAGGVRVGWTVAPLEIAKAMTRLQSHITSGTATQSQHIALAAISQPYDLEMLRDLEVKREIFYSKSAQIPGVSFLPSEGAYYAFADVRSIFGMKSSNGLEIKSSEDLADYLLNEAGIVCVSGSAFQQEGYLRFMYHIEERIIEEGLSAMKEAIEKLS